jgi:hypothetical protein
MTKDDARKLMSAYATGSLSEAERKALFEAALEDQDLFDELAGEQALKEVLDEPGALRRLIAALEPPRHWAWVWITVAATVAIAVVVLVTQRTPPPQQIAQVLKSPEPLAAPIAPAPAPAPAPALPRAVRKVPPAATVPTPPAETRQDVAEQLADKLQSTKPEAQARGGARPAAAAFRAENAVTAAFALNYTVRADGNLEIVPMSPGFLLVTANDAVIFPSAVANAGTPVRIPIPSDATNLVVTFSRRPGVTGTPVRRDEASGTVTDQDAPNGRIIIQLSPTPVTQ